MRRFAAIPFLWLLLPQVVAIIVIYYCKPSVFLPKEPEWINKKAVYEVQLLTIPDTTKKWIRAEAELINIVDSGKLQSITGKIILYIGKDSTSTDSNLTSTDSVRQPLSRGDIILAFMQPQHSNKGNPQEFDYDSYLLHQGISATAFVWHNSYRKIGHKPTKSPKALAEELRAKCVEVFSNYGIETKELGVLSALTIGERDLLDPQTRKQYQAAGAMHVLAVSGLHTGIVYGAFYLLLTLFGFYPVLYRQTARKYINICILIIVVWIYALITGFSPSVVRASLMLTLYTIGKALNKQTNTYNIIFASAFLTLFFSPLALFSISFQLSYSAVIAIVYFYPKLYKLLNIRTRIMRWMWGMLTVSIAAQLGTIPITLWYFCQTSNYFALTNFIAIPSATIIIYTTLLFFILFKIPFVGKAVAWLLNKEVWLMNCTIEKIEALPHSSTNLSLTPAMLALLLLVIIFLALYVYRQRWQWLAAISITIIVFLTLDCLHLKSINSTNQLILFNHSTPLLIHQQGREITILTNDIEQASSRTENFRKQQMITSTSYIDLKSNPAYSFKYKDLDFLIVQDSVFKHKSLKKTIECNYLLVGAYIAPYQDITHKLHADTIILLPTLKQWQQQTLISTLDSTVQPYKRLQDFAPRYW